MCLAALEGYGAIAQIASKIRAVQGIGLLFLAESQAFLPAFR
jgi:hypothetical protein